MYSLSLNTSLHCIVVIKYHPDLYKAAILFSPALPQTNNLIWASEDEKYIGQGRFLIVGNTIGDGLAASSRVVVTQKGKVVLELCIMICLCSDYMTDKDVEHYIRENIVWTRLPTDIRAVLGNSQREYDKLVLEYSIKNQLRYKGNIGEYSFCFVVTWFFMNDRK